YYSDTIGTLAANATIKITLVALVANNLPFSDILSNTASVSTTTTDPNLAPPDISHIDTMVSTDSYLAVTNTGPATVPPGANATYTIKVTNNGPSEAQSVSLMDALPANTGFVSTT